MALASAEDEVTPGPKTIRIEDDNIYMPGPSTLRTVFLILSLLSCNPIIIDRCLTPGIHPLERDNAQSPLLLRLEIFD